MIFDSKVSAALKQLFIEMCLVNTQELFLKYVV